MGRYRTGLVAVFVAAFVAGGAVIDSPATAAVEKTYITMADGVKIAVAINRPEGFSDGDRAKWPTLLQMDGYGAAGGDGVGTASWGEKYVTIYASVRGTGCSGGRFDLFDRRHAMDGWEIIENWIVKQPWSNGKVGIIGHSYPGLTGFMVATTNPPHLTAIAVSGLIDDLYRGQVYPGGVPNFGFPLVWTGAYRPGVELSGNAGRYVDETAGGDPTCLANIATRPPREPLDDPIPQGLTSRDDETYWQIRSLSSHVHGITKPIHMTQQFQDEQTGPRGANVLFQRITGVPKRLALTNGVHGTNALANADKRAWMACWILQDGRNCGAVADPNQRVQVFFETKDTTTRPAEYVGSDWPLPETQWTEFLLRADGTLSTDPAGGDGDVSYVSLPAGREMTLDFGFGFGDNGVGQLTFVDGPDEAVYRLPFTKPTAIAGPVKATIWGSTTAPDTDWFVDILDRDTATGAVTYLQRGALRASHRALDELRSDRIPSGPLAGTIYRPFHPHTSPVPVVPLTPEKYEIEIFPVAHHFRAGHELVMKVHAPPPADPVSLWAWISTQPPAVNTIHQAEGMRSALLLPVLPSVPGVGPVAPACGELVGNPCFVPAA